MGLRGITQALALLIWAHTALGQTGSPLPVVININTAKGHNIVRGASGFNARIGDKPWSYDHPDFISAVHELKPGWLRYWSGTAGDAFCAGTGQYDKEYINLFDKGEDYEKLYKFMEVKGPARLYDLYQLIGSVGGRVVVTVNAFTETPEMTVELARFCKNNNIQVECWQFCNEPYFYIPGRQRYWWNDGYDYAQKMKPHADSIRRIFPDAKMALNFTWDGIWGFMKEINQYQKQQGAFWNTFSKHSYAPHTGKEENFEEASRRMNTKLLEATGDKAMQEIEQWTSKGIPMLITEFGVWNKPLNGISSAIYNAEYTMRQLAHPNTWLIASHEISNKIKPARNLNKQIMQAYEAGQKLTPSELTTGLEWDDEGRAMCLVHSATGNSDFIYQTSLTGGAQVDGMNNTKVEALYAEAFRGVGGEDFILITNRSGVTHVASLQFDGASRNVAYKRSWINGEKGTEKGVMIHHSDASGSSHVEIPAFSVTLLQWKHGRAQLPSASRVYGALVEKQGIALKWWPVADAAGYEVTVYDETSRKKTVKQVKDPNWIFQEAVRDHTYSFRVAAKNLTGSSDASSAVSVKYALPQQPSIFKLAPRADELTVFWHSVPNAWGYRVKLVAKDGSSSNEYDAKNVFGYKIKGLALNKTYDVMVTAYNGLGNGRSSTAASFTSRQNIPLPPTNISAIEDASGAIVLRWNAPNDPVPGTRYRLYRGEALHKFTMLKENLTDTSFVDNSTSGRNYFYTVKSYTAGGECNFYPNTATIIRSSKAASVSVKSITRSGDDYTVVVSLANVPTDGEVVNGVLLSDVSYLNGEEVLFRGTAAANGTYTVVIPAQQLKKGATYAVKAMVRTNGGAPVLSLPPFEQLKVM